LDEVDADKESDNEQDSDFEPKEIVDSELKISDGDDGIFEDNVDDSYDEEVMIPKGQGKGKEKSNMLEPK
jgi:hypothetical protein